MKSIEKELILLLFEWDYLLYHAFSQEGEQYFQASEDFQEVGPEEKGARRKLSLSAALEDKICDLYDLYVEVRVSFLLQWHFLHCSHVLNDDSHFWYTNFLHILLGTWWRCWSTNQKVVRWGDLQYCAFNWCAMLTDHSDSLLSLNWNKAWKAKWTALCNYERSQISCCHFFFFFF